jgi:proline iminopeptidase
LLLLTLACPVYGQNSSDTSHATDVAASSKNLGLHPPGDYARVNGVKLWYESEGSGPPLVLIAGGPGLSHSYLHPHFSMLATSYRVIYYDAFGTGQSDRAHDPHEYTFSRDVENLEGLRKALGLGKINVLGHSYGGMVAQAYALRYPDSVQKLILVDASWGGEMSQAHRDNANYEIRNQYPESFEKRMKMHERGLLSCSEEYGKVDDANELFLLFYNTSASEKLIHAEPGNDEVFCALNGDDPDFVEGGDLGKLDFRLQLKDLKMPMLIMAGRFDRIMFPRYSMQFKTYAPQAQFVMFEKSGHFPFIEEPEQFFTVSKDFLR